MTPAPPRPSKVRRTPAPALCAGLRLQLVLMSLAWIGWGAASLVAAPTWDPIERYETHQIEGWTVRVNQQLLKQEQLAHDVLRLLEVQLYQVVRVIPTHALACLRAIPIWVELALPRHPCMCYHPSAEWLRDHDMNPAKAGSVEIANATNFLSWTKQQPWMVLHELAHGFHHLTLGHGHPELNAAYKKAVAAKSYERVRHYALNNDQEYFAEATEAFFGTNDYYPFVRPELKRHDPEIFDLLGRLWGTTAPKSK